jgi:hypothetical protein
VLEIIDKRMALSNTALILTDKENRNTLKGSRSLPGVYEQETTMHQKQEVERTERRGFHLNLEGRGGRCVAVNNIPLFVNQKLAKVPLDTITQDSSSFVGFQEFVDRSLFWPIHINLQKPKVPDCFWISECKGLLKSKQLARDEYSRPNKQRMMP